jgi:hypothetical protein
MTSEAKKIVKKGEAAAEERAQALECAGDDEGDQAAEVKELTSAHDAAVCTLAQPDGIKFNGKAITLDASRVETKPVQ